MDFREDGLYSLDFGERNATHCFIHGHFLSIRPNSEVVLTWNVEGFRPVSDTDTLVTLSIEDQDGATRLELRHEKIETQDSADSKRRSWNEILTELETRLTRYASNS